MLEGRFTSDPDSIEIAARRNAAKPPERQGTKTPPPPPAPMPLVVLGPGEGAQTGIYANKFGRLRKRVMNSQTRKALGQSTQDFVLGVSMERLKADARRRLQAEIRKTA